MFYSIHFYEMNLNLLALSLQHIIWLQCVLCLFCDERLLKTIELPVYLETVLMKNR